MTVGNYVVPHVSQGERDALQSRVVRLGAPGGEGDLTRAAAQRPGDRPAGRVHDAAALLGERVDAGRVAEVLREVRHHGSDHLGTDRRRRGMVHINQPVGRNHLIHSYKQLTPSPLTGEGWGEGDLHHLACAVSNHRKTMLLSPSPKTWVIVACSQPGTCPKPAPYSDTGLVCTLLGARASRPHPFVSLQIYCGSIFNLPQTRYTPSTCTRAAPRSLRWRPALLPG